MPHKAFSGRMKKEQLKLKKQQKRDKEELTKERERKAFLGEEVKEPERKPKKRKADDPAGKAAAPPADARNKLVTVFAKESRADLERRKTESRRPLHRLPPSARRLSEDEQLKREIDMPVRPRWEYDVAKQVLEKREQKYFTEWLHAVYEAHPREELNYFEHNLEVWRQLWRVIELSDILFVVVDARYPSFHFPSSLYKHVTEDHQKPIVVIINKIDLISEQALREWVVYFNTRYPLLHVVPFSSQPRPPVAAKDLVTLEDEIVFRKRKKRIYSKIPAFGVESLLEACEGVRLSKTVDGLDWKVAHRRATAESPEGSGSGERSDGEVGAGPRPATDPRHDPDSGAGSSFITIGMVGHPNVGKSALINGLMGKHVVSVKRTPGHTKHFQTLFLTPHIRLCDCPGLVFPATGMSKPLQVVCGLVPIAKLPEPFTAIALLASYLPLEQFYGLKHPRIIEAEECDEAYEGPAPEWSAWDICESFAIKRGFFLSKSGRPDPYRAAQVIMYDCLDGNITLSFKPPLPSAAVDWSSVSVAAPPVEFVDASGHDDGGSVAEEEPQGSDNGEEEGGASESEGHGSSGESGERIGGGSNAFAALLDAGDS